jgi:hypothetical protein
LWKTVFCSCVILYWPSHGYIFFRLCYFLQLDDVVFAVTVTQIVFGLCCTVYKTNARKKKKEKNVVWFSCRTPRPCVLYHPKDGTWLTLSLFETAIVVPHETSQYNTPHAWDLYNNATRTNLVHCKCFPNVFLNDWMSLFFSPNIFHAFTPLKRKTITTHVSSRSPYDKLSNGLGRIINNVNEANTKLPNTNRITNGWWQQSIFI